MATYGPWNGPAEYVETQRIMGGAEEGGDPLTFSAEISPPVKRTSTDYYDAGLSGWSLRETSILFPIGSANGNLLEHEPEYGLPTQSETLWQVARESTLLGSGNSAPFVNYHGYNEYTLTSGPYKSMYDEWNVRALQIPLERVEQASYNFRNIAQVPPPSEWPDGAYGIDYETPDSATTLQQVTVGWDADADTHFRLLVKDAGGDGSGWHHGSSTSTPSWFDMAGNAVDVGPAGTSYTLNAALLQELRELDPSVRRDERPLLGIGWVGNSGEWPGNFAGPDFEYPVHNLNLTLTLRYTATRWRYIYDTPPSTPYRRTSHRHDSLAGGATRNYPPSRALQTSNRIGGGYL